MISTRHFLLVLPAVALTSCSWFQSGPAKNPDPNHTHADFAVWMDGVKMDFSRDIFMSGSSTDEGTHPEQGPRKYFHLHDGNGTVIHRHKPELTLKEFFDSLPVGFSGNCFTSGVPMEDGEVCTDHPWRLFMNGQERTPFDLNFAFEDTDHILITNAVDQAEVQKELLALTDDACMYSKVCPERGDPPTENCIADPEVPCVDQ